MLTTCCAYRVNPALHVPQALCMCTTRELAAQNLAVLRRMAKYTGITSTSTADSDEGGGGARGRKLVEQVSTNSLARMRGARRRGPIPHTGAVLWLLLLPCVSGGEATHRVTAVITLFGRQGQYRCPHVRAHDSSSTSSSRGAGPLWGS